MTSAAESPASELGQASHSPHCSNASRPQVQVYGASHSMENIIVALSSRSALLLTGDRPQEAVNPIADPAPHPAQFVI